MQFYRKQWWVEIYIEVIRRNGTFVIDETEPIVKQYSGKE